MIAQKNISYYNEIAPEYDTILEKERSNEIVRKTVANSFTRAVNKGWVVDFGGGTGQDLNWLIKNEYKVIFCEPSIGMRKIAMQNASSQFPNSTIVFLDDADTHFTGWAASPFEQKVEAALLNFAVLNCIPNIDELFKILSLMIKPGGHIFALILDNSFLTLLKKNPKAVAKNVFFRSPIVSTIQYHNHSQTVYIHTKKELKKAFSPYFKLHDWKLQKGSGFILLHLVKA